MAASQCVIEMRICPPEEFGVGGGDKGFHYQGVVVGTGTLKLEVI